MSSVRADTGGKGAIRRFGRVLAYGRLAAVGENGAILHSTDGDNLTNASASELELLQA